MSLRAAALRVRGSYLAAAPFTLLTASRLPLRSALPRRLPGLVCYYAKYRRPSPPPPPQSSSPDRTSEWAKLRLNDDDKRRLARAQLDAVGDIPKNLTEAEESRSRIDTASVATGEYNPSAEPSQNTFSSSQPGPEPRRVRDPISSPRARSNEFQEEFEGPKSEQSNAVPKSQPKGNGEDVEAFAQSNRPLPDLRQGIPSTFEAEFSGSNRKQYTGEAESHDPRTVDEAETQERIAKEHGQQETAGSGRGGGYLPKSAYETSTDRKRNKFANYGYLTIFTLGSFAAIYLGRDWESDEEAKRHPNIPSGWGLSIFWERIKARVNDSLGYYTEPTFPRLLPDLDSIPQHPEYTLVLSLEDLMVHSEWSRQHGYRTGKRPGLDYFIRYLSQYYEIVMFTSIPMAQAEPVYRKLDPYHLIMWPLFREATRYSNGEYIKDVAYLNRDPSKVIFLDTKPSAMQANPENAIILKPWKGDPKDRELVAYVPFLEHLAAVGVPDVRKAIASFQGKQIPAEYARRESIAREAFNKQRAEEQSKRSKKLSGLSIASMLGMKPQPAPGSMVYGDDGSTVSEGYEKGLMLTDQIRERGRKHYEHLENMIRTQGDQMLKEMEEEEKKMQEEMMKSMKGGVVGWFGGQKNG